MWMMRTPSWPATSSKCRRYVYVCCACVGPIVAPQAERAGGSRQTRWGAQTPRPSLHDAFLSAPRPIATGTENLRFTSPSPITTANMGDRIPPPMPGHLPSSFDDNEYAMISQYIPPFRITMLTRLQRILQRAAHAKSRPQAEGRAAHTPRSANPFHAPQMLLISSRLTLPQASVSPSSPS